MATITALTCRGPRLVEVEIDHEQWAVLSKRVADALRLTVGDGVDRARLLDKRAEIESRQALQMCARLLNVRARSKAEIVGRMMDRGISPDTVQATVGKLEKAGMIDDAKFARDWVEQRGAARPASQRTRKAELAHFGVQSDIVDEALAADEASDDLSLARAAISKWHRGISVSPSDTEALRDWTRRAISFLQRRGFSWDIVRTVVAERFGADVGGDAGEYGRDTQ